MDQHINSIIIVGSARKNSNTLAAVKTVIHNYDLPIIDLLDYNIAPYDYEYRNKNDDYIPLMENIVKYDLIILATPVYWYSMSTTMKIFIDRLADLTDIRKDLGRKLKGKKLYIIASYHTSLPRGFQDPFEQTCKYLGIEYLGCCFINNGHNEKLTKLNNVEIDKARKIVIL